jgi:hypothetical protein
MSDDLERFADDEGHPVAKVGLRSLREEIPPLSSKKATLAALRAAQEPARSTGGTRTFLVWALLGAAIAGVVAYLLFFR